MRDLDFDEEKTVSANSDNTQQIMDFEIFLGSHNLGKSEQWAIQCQNVLRMPYLWNFQTLLQAVFDKILVTPL